MCCFGAIKWVLPVADELELELIVVSGYLAAS
jgi:hypothetical protein